MDPTLLFLAGLMLGLAIGIGFAVWRVRDVRAMASAASEQAEERRRAETEALTSQLKDAFGALSMEALSRNTEEFLKVASEKLSNQSAAGNKELEGKKILIDQTLKSMKAELDKVQTMVHGVEKDRKAHFASLTEQINKAASETRQLRDTAHGLKAALTNSRVRGQWGERMAEDVLRLAGFVEGINYTKQGTLEGEAGGRPDYTFRLPQGRVVHMDVKFPLENYLQYLSAEDEEQSLRYRDQFMRDTRRRIDEVTRRAYVDPHADTLDYVLVFIPNEQVYAFINEHDRTLLDETLKKKIVLCSPTTLYAVLAVIRQAVDNFHLERTAGEILGLLANFHKQWDKFTEAMDKVGKKLEESQRAYEDMSGVRTRQLEKPLNKITLLRESGKLEGTAAAGHLRLVEGGSAPSGPLAEITPDEDAPTN